MLNAMRLLICMHSQIRTDWKLNVQKVVHSRLGKELIKEKRDVYSDLPEPSEHLLGEKIKPGREKPTVDEVGASIG